MLVKEHRNMKRVVATGTFDILHPGHLYYLEQSKKLGDELWVIISRECNVVHKQLPIIPEEQRLQMICGLRCVDHAILGDERDMYRPIAEINPDIITIGCNQRFSEKQLIAELRSRDLIANVVRIGECTNFPFISSTSIINEVIQRRVHTYLKDTF